MYFFVLLFVLLACIKVEAADQRTSIVFAPKSQITYFHYNLIIPDRSHANGSIRAVLQSADNKTLYEHVLEGYELYVSPWSLKPYVSGHALPFLNKSVEVSPGDVFHASGFNASQGQDAHWTDKLRISYNSWFWSPAKESEDTLAVKTLSNSHFTQAQFANDFHFQAGVPAVAKTVEWQNVHIEALTKNSKWCTSPLINNLFENDIAYSPPRTFFSAPAGAAAFTSCTIDRIHFYIPE